MRINHRMSSASGDRLFTARMRGNHNMSPTSGERLFTLIARLCFGGNAAMFPETRLRRCEVWFGYCIQVVMEM